MKAVALRRVFTYRVREAARLQMIKRTIKNSSNSESKPTLN